VAADPGYPPPGGDPALRGYAGRYPAVAWPGGARVAVSFVLNVEEGAQFALSHGDERNEPVHEVKRELTGVPDLNMTSHFAYGARAGYWRITHLLHAAGAGLTLNVCGRALEATPWVGADARARGFEITAHGWRWEAHSGMDEATERTTIARTVAAIERHWGERPRGWHTRASASPNTRRLLVEAGFEYDSDAYDDDCPHYVAVDGRPHLVLPYAFDTNDMRFFDSHAFVQADDFARYVCAAYDTLWAEGAAAPRMMSIGLHSRIIGRPARIGALTQILDHLRVRGGAWLARRGDIARHWRTHCPPPA
jgi:peptidoglycan/xylan/chitin deacetylase (PgdA/CDA1 family)